MSRRGLVVVGTAVALACAAAGAHAAGQEPAGGYLLAFGDVHNHTRYSDGSAGTPADAFAAAKGAGADFLATSDHNFMLTDDEWTLTRQQAAAATTTGEFAALAATEYWITNGYGEVIVLGVDDIRTKANFRSPRAKLSRHEVIPAFLDWLAGEGGIGVWPHPGFYGDLDDFAHWSEARDEAMAGIEIHNYGSYVGAPASWGVHDYEPDYRRALERGWHLMPLAVSDTHAPNWISGSPVRTVLLVPAPLTPDAILDALRAQRGYATLDENLRISFRLGGAVMGETVAAAAAGGLEAEISVHDPDGAGDAITKLELVTEGGLIVDSIALNASSTTWTPTVGDDVRWVYLRVTTASDVSGAPGVTAWTAPVWVERTG